MPEQSDFGFWKKDDGSSLGPLRPELNAKMLREIFDDRLLNAALYTQSTDTEVAFTARMVLGALTAVQNELKRRMR